MCTRVRKVENRAGGCEVEWRHAFDVPSSSWARGSLSLSLFFLPGTCATTRRRNERSTPVNQRWRAGAFPILYEHRLMNFIIRAWAFSKRFDSPDNNDRRSWKIRRIFITHLWKESRKKIPFWFIFSSINRNTKGLQRITLLHFLYTRTCIYVYSRLDRLMVIKWNFFVLFMQLIVCRIKNTWRVFREFKSGRSKNIPSYFFDENLVACIVYKHDGYALHDPFNEL